MTTLDELPTKIRSISKPNWTDVLRWLSSDLWAMAEVDHDWRIWVHLENGRSVVRNKGALRAVHFATLDLGLESLDYRVDS